MPMATLICLLLLLMVVPNEAAVFDDGWQLQDKVMKNSNSTRWAVLVAGSFGYRNYRHQVDVCHAYQILKRGGLKDENIIVFMYDDIAKHSMNPRQGIIINSLHGHDLYAGVPKGYVGKDVTIDNLFAMLLGDKKSIKGGSGKVVYSEPDDQIFFYYSSHGGPGVLGMLASRLPLLANHLNEVLKKKHVMVIYLESCESGSMFEGLLSKDLNIYVTTASKAVEDSYATYCLDTNPPAPAEYTTCLGDLYSIAWMEDSETHNLKKETLEQQYKKVKKRTSNNNNYSGGSHVMEYGTLAMKPKKLYLYQGFHPSTANPTPLYNQMGTVNQYDVDIMFLRQRYNRASESDKPKISKEIRETLAHRQHLESSIEMIGVHLFGQQNGSSILQLTRGLSLPLVDDWDCFKSTALLYEKHCGPLTTYGFKYMRSFANICNKFVKEEVFEEACIRTCKQ